MPRHSLEGFTPISSDHIDGAKYDSIARKMTIRFQNGYVYDVHGVSGDTYRAFMSAPSQGQHYHDHIKDHYHVERVK